MKINFKHYKAFAEGSIDIRPLTFLLGANSSGKSSIQQLILMLEQTITNKGEYKSALKLNGHYVNLGEDENVFLDRNDSNPLVIEFEIESTPIIAKLENAIVEIEEQFDHLLLYATKNGFYAVNDLRKKTHPAYVANLHLQKTDDPFIQFIKGEKIIYNASLLIANTGIERQIIEKLSVESLNLYFGRYNKLISTIKANRKLLKKTSRFIFGYSFKLGNNKRIKIESNYLKIDDEILIKINGDGLLSSDISSVNEFVRKIIDLKPKYNCLKLNVDIPQLLVDRYFISQLFICPFDIISDFFQSDNISYVSPLRAYPQRYYLLDDSNVYSKFNSMSGKELAEILKQRSDITSKINKWLELFHLSISVSEFKDIIHNIKVNQNNLSLDITDVGFGISQVLPILVQGYISSPGATILIEQPEIHLHPRMQAELADLFIEIIKTRNRDSDGTFKKNSTHLVIETHSEYILKRLRRRIAEKEITNDKVAIYFIEPRTTENYSAKINNVNIGTYGEIEWPKDFYSTEFEDDIEFLRSSLANKK